MLVLLLVCGPIVCIKKCLICRFAKWLVTKEIEEQKPKRKRRKQVTESSSNSSSELSEKPKKKQRKEKYKVKDIEK